MVRMIRELISNRRFEVKLGFVTSKNQFLKNEVPQGSVLAPTMFNIYKLEYDIRFVVAN